jgi:hypothetical protein
VERYEASQGIQFKGGQTKAWGRLLTRRKTTTYQTPCSIRPRASSTRTMPSGLPRSDSGA